MSTALRSTDSARVAFLKRKLDDLRWFHGYIDQLSAASGEISADDFAAIVQKATDDFDVDRLEMASRFSVNKGTISRWSSGHNAPQAFARPMVLQWLCAQIAERKKAVKAELIEAEAGRVPSRQSR